MIDTGKPVFLPFRMSSFVLSNLVVTAGMLTPGLQVHPPNSSTPINRILIEEYRQQAPSSGK
jgi:hypothetical protein